MRHLLSVRRSFFHRLVAVPSMIAVMLSGLIIGVPEVKAQSEDQCSDSSDSSTACEVLERGASHINPWLGDVVYGACELYEMYQEHPEYACGFLIPDPAYGHNPDAQELYEECVTSSSASNSDPTVHYDYSEGICKLPQG